MCRKDTENEQSIAKPPALDKINTGVCFFAFSNNFEIKHK